MGKISLFSLASPNSFEFYRVDSHHSSAAALASPTPLTGLLQVLQPQIDILEPPEGSGLHPPHCCCML